MLSMNYELIRPDFWVVASTHTLRGQIRHYEFLIISDYVIHEL